MGNFITALNNALRGKCLVFPSDMQIFIPATGLYTYPDLSVVCGKPVIEKIEGFDVLTNPILIVEVLSPSTESRDRKEKRTAYQGIPSLREYLLVAQAAPHITHFLRQSDEWVRADYGSLSASVVLPSIDCVLALSDVYQGVDFG